MHHERELLYHFDAQVIAGVCTEEDHELLFEWLGEDKKRLSFFVRLTFQIRKDDDSELDDIPTNSDDESDELTPEELEELLRDFWNEIRRRNIE